RYHLRGHPDLPRTPLSLTVWQQLRFALAAAGINLTENERHLARLHNQHAGERAFIIGNGPSLNQHNLDLLATEVTFGTNNIHLRSDPTYYVVEDYLIAEDRADEINPYNGAQIKFAGNYLRYCLAESVKTVWLNIPYDYTDFPGFPHFSTDARRAIYVGGTVSYLCMQLAFYMGFTEVYLIGFDHSYDVQSDAPPDGNRLIARGDDLNHFSADYLRKGDRWHVPNIGRMERAYVRARKTYEQHGRTIANATIGGQLEVFERVSYDSLFR
ncbi:MAG: hypothetical protein AAFV33_13685, partial [Chloroflexota bacterium]